MTHTYMSATATVPKLEVVHLNDTAVTDAGLAEFNRFPSLRRLSISKRGAGDSSLAIVGRLPNLGVREGHP